MVFPFVPFNAFAEEEGYTLTFTVNGNHTIEANIQADNTAKIGEIVIDGQFVSLKDADGNNVGEVTILNEGKEAKIYVEDGTGASLTFNSDEKFSLFVNGQNYTMGAEFNSTTNNFIAVQDYVPSNPGGENQPQGGENQLQGGNSTAILRVKGGAGSYTEKFYDEEQQKEVSETKYYADSYSDARFAINGGYVRDLRPEDEIKDTNGNRLYSEFTYNYNAEETDTKVTISFKTLFIQAFKDTIKVNNNTYQVADYIDYSDRTDYLNAYSQQELSFDIEVPKADDNIYEIEVNVGPSEENDVYIGNFLWTSDPNKEDEDVYIGHSKLRFVSATYEVGGTEYTTKAEDIVHGRGDYVEFGVGSDYMNPDYEGGSLVLPEGAEVTMLIIPEYGYQVEYISSNGGEMIAGDSISEFKFQIHKGNFHLGAKVVPVKDEVKSSTNKVEGGSIVIDSNEIDAGSVQLSVKDVTPSTTKVAEFEEKAGDYTVSEYLNISLDQVFYKGTADNVWKNEIEDLNEEATISLQLAEAIDPENTVILHNIHDGDNFETIEIESYDANTNTITFKTKSFSNYAIATKVSATNTGTENINTTTENNTTGTASSNPITGDNIILFVTIFAIATLGIFTTIKLSKKHKVRKH